ncbi:hypothetical protein V2J09_018258 [Rumex salicifolius]
MFIRKVGIEKSPNNPFTFCHGQKEGSLKGLKTGEEEGRVSLEALRQFMGPIEAADRAKEAMIKKDNILSRFIQLGDVDPTYLRDIILNFIIAGKDTTAATLSWFISLLCKHPHIQEKLSQEIKNATKVYTVSNYAEVLTNLHEDSLERMQYLHAALTETFRLYPAVPVDPKVCFSDDTLPDGFSVNKGDMVYYEPYAMGRMKSLWGDDAESFRPERWLSVDGLFQQESPFKFTAFQIFSAVLLSSFRFRLGDESKPVNYKMMINLHVDGGLHVEVLCR